MSKLVSLPLQTLYAELVDRAAVAQLLTDFAVQGSFYATSIKGRSYWYFRGPQEDGRRTKRYVGPDTPEVRAMIQAHREAKDDYRQRREMVSALTRVGLKAPDTLTGRVLEALAEAGVFRMRAVVVGTIAYQCYSGLLGVKLGASNAMTSDLDLAQFPSISIAIDDATERPIEEILRRVDPGFRPVAHISDRTRVTQYALGSRYRVELLAPNRGPDTDKPVALPALQAHGQALRFLDYLIYQEVRAVALYGPGVLVNVPAPERYTLHKLIVSRARLEAPDSQVKAAKDLRQAAELIMVLAEQRPYELKEAWNELISRGPGWRARATEALQLLPQAAGEMLRACTG